jgi:tetratricopeptide (TPR) repeat protein
MGFFIAVISFLFIIEIRLRTKIPFLGKMIIPVFICITIVFSGATYARNLVWTDEARLWEDVIEKSPMKSRGYSNLGSIYYKRGEYDKALEHLNRSIEVDDISLDIERTYANRGLVYFTTGKYDRALDDFNKAIFINPYFKEMYYLRGNVFLSKKMLNEARDDFQKSCNMGDSNGCSKLESLKR